MAISDTVSGGHFALHLNLLQMNVLFKRQYAAGKMVWLTVSLTPGKRLQLAFPGVQHLLHFSGMPLKPGARS
jgi:hypothetical protein